MICKLANGKRRYREDILKQNWQVQRGSFRRGGGEVNVKCKICSFSKKVLVRGTRQNKINTRSLGIIICIYAIIIIKIRKNTCLLSANGKKLPFQLAKGTPRDWDSQPGRPHHVWKRENLESVSHFDPSSITTYAAHMTLLYQQHEKTPPPPERGSYLKAGIWL